MSADHLLEVVDLRVSFATEDGVVRAVDGVSFYLDAGEALAVVGESGSGKSAMSMTLMGLTRDTNATFNGQVYFNGAELIGASENTLRHIRGRDIAMIFQDPMSALNPVYRVGEQIAEQIRAHERISRRRAGERAIELMTRVGIPQAKDRAGAYPHEFSGGMRQRVMIAMAFSCSPRVLIADEPTTALDVTVQAQILAEMRELCQESGVALILVTHDFGIVAEVAERALVMYAGQMVEQATVEELFEDPQHPYTWGLLGSVPRLDRPRSERLPTIGGSTPSLLNPVASCRFAPRCPHVFDRCEEVPPLGLQVPGQHEHRDRCWLSVDDKRALRVVGGAIGLATPSGPSS
jgi:peptide/nickel transport system ATP-binding protein/oligopeptide transport system ATP-binding protein